MITAPPFRAALLLKKVVSFAPQAARPSKDLVHTVNDMAAPSPTSSSARVHAGREPAVGKERIRPRSKRWFGLAFCFGFSVATATTMWQLGDLWFVLP